MRTLLASALLAFSLPAAADCTTASVTLTLEPNWEAYVTGSPGAPFAIPVATKDCMGVVRIEAALRYTGTLPGLTYTTNPVSGELVRNVIFPAPFSLPAGYAPTYYQIFPMSTALVPGEIHIAPWGGVTVVGDYAKTLTIFSGVSYRTP